MSRKMLYRDLDLRILLLEHIARTAHVDTEYFVALEARYAASDRRADVLVVSDYSHAYEIKSDVDRLDRLPEQIRDYRQTFDFLTVVTTQLHARKVKKMLGMNDGLIVMSDEGANVVIEAKKNKKIARKNMIFMCSKPVLAKALSVSAEVMSLGEMRKLAERKLSVAELRHVMFRELKRRFKKKYEEFLKEASIPYRESDLVLLKYNDKLFTNLLVA